MSQEHKQVNTLNERFTLIADQVSELLGAWWFTVVSFILLLLWTFYGLVFLGHLTDSAWFTSQQWNFPLNTVTTVGEWFIGALVAAATNRVERRHDMLLEKIEALSAANLRTNKQEEEDMQVIKRLLAKVVVE